MEYNICFIAWFANNIRVGSTANNFGSGTINAFNKYVKENGPIQEQEDGDTKKNNIYGIIQGGLLCKGYSIGATGPTCNFFGGTANAIKNLKEDAGLTDDSSVVTLNIMKALMSMDYFDTSERALNIVQIQRYLNRNYEDYIGLRPCDGVYGSRTNKAMIYAIQAEEAMPITTANGNFGPSTKKCCPTLPFEYCTQKKYNNTNYSEDDLKKFTVLANMALYLNGYDVNFNNESLELNYLHEFQNAYAIPKNNKCDIVTWMSLLVSSGDPDRSAIACDCATIITEDNIDVLIDNGFKYIARYLSGSYLHTDENGIIILVSKALTTEEIQLLFKKGIRLFPIFQGSGNYVNYFTEEQAEIDAKKAVEAANDINLEFGAIIYFAVDCDVMDYQVTSHIVPYFKKLYYSFMSERGNKFRIGIYGTRNTCTRVCAEGYACSSFVSDMSTGYSGNLGFSIPKNWALDQFATTTIYNKDKSHKIDIDKDGFSGRYPGIFYEYNINSLMGYDSQKGGRIYVNMGNTSITVYREKTPNTPVVQVPMYLGHDKIGEIKPGDFYVRYNVTQIVKDTVHKVLYKDGDDVRMGYIEEYYYLNSNGEIVDSYIPDQKYFNYINYDPVTKKYKVVSEKEYQENGIIFTVNKPVPYFDGTECVGILKKGDKIKVTGSSYSIYGASRLWTIFVSHVYNKETDSFDEFNKFVSVGLELGCSKEDRALY